MTQEAGDDRVAAWWTAQAVLFARESDDPRTVGYALVRRAELALYRQDSLATVDLAARAQLEQDVGPRVLGLAARCEAQGHALAGNAADCMIALGRATDLLREAAEADPPTMPVLGSSVGAEEARLALGWSLFDLGRPQEAAEVLTASLDSIPSHSHRARARFSVRLALSHAHAGDVGQSCARIRSVLDQVIRVDSATIRADLRMLARVLNRWPTDAAVLRTRPMLIQALTAAVGE
jgi:tetratricopeptide (TPR) repeat protein